MTSIQNKPLKRKKERKRISRRERQIQPKHSQGLANRSSGPDMSTLSDQRRKRDSAPNNHNHHRAKPISRKIKPAFQNQTMKIKTLESVRSRKKLHQHTRNSPRIARHEDRNQDLRPVIDADAEIWWNSIAAIRMCRVQSQERSQKF